jgi:hypothetical protein
MKATDVLKIMGIVLLALFVLIVALPLVFTLLHIAVGFLVVLAITLIKVAIFVAIIYLIVVGIRAVLR